MSTPSDRELLDLDLYHLLDPTDTLTSSSPQTDISRHYRKRARLLHPDKNPNNPLAASQFDTLQRAYELLTDEAKRSEYDDKRRLREEKKRKVAAEDVRVRVMRERLEEREKAAKVGWESNKRQMAAARIQRENEAVIAQLRQTTAAATAGARRDDSKQAAVEERTYADSARSNVDAEGAVVGAGLNMAAFEASTLERMREMARRKKEERLRHQQNQSSGTSTHTTDSGGSSSSSVETADQPAVQQEREVIVLDDTSGAVT